MNTETADQVLRALESYEMAVDVVGQRDALFDAIDALATRASLDGWTVIAAAEVNDRVHNGHVGIRYGNGPRCHRYGLAHWLLDKLRLDGGE